jgi:tetratricopeptide (TPR) repeat protein
MSSLPPQAWLLLAFGLLLCPCHKTHAGQTTGPAIQSSPHARRTDAPAQLVEELAALLDRGQLTPAKAQVEEALRRYPSNAALHNIAGAIEAQLGAYRDAERHFRAAISADPRIAPAYLNLGRLYQEHAKEDPDAPQKALAVYREWLTVDPANAEALFQAAYLSAGAGDWTTSRAFIRRLLAGPHAKEPGASESLRQLGVVYASEGQFDGARELLEGAMRSAGAANAPLLLDLARVAYKQQDFKGALGYLAHARDLDPGNAQVHFFFGIACIELNLGSEAYESLKKAVTLAPDNAYVNYALGAVSIHRREASEAVPYFEAYLRLKPNDPRGRFALGAARFYSNDFDRARSDLEQAARSAETAAGAHYFLGKIARQLNQLDTAREEIGRALQANPNYADALAELGLLQTRSGEYEAAEQSLAKALAGDPENYFATFNLAALYARTRDPRREAQADRLAALQQKRAVAAQEFLRIIQVVQ